HKMEVIGRVAGGVAHDFNNLLTVMMGYSELVLANLPPDVTLHSFVEEILRAGACAASLARQLLIFSRKRATEPIVLDLNAVITGMAKWLRRLIGEHVELTSVLAPALCPV